MNILKTGISKAHRPNAFVLLATGDIPSKPWEGVMTTDITIQTEGSTRGTVVRVEFDEEDVVSAFSGLIQGLREKVNKSDRVNLELHGMFIQQKEKAENLEKEMKTKCNLNLELQTVTDAPQSPPSPVQSEEQLATAQS